MLAVPLMVRRWRRNHPLARRCLVAWALVLPLALWVESLSGANWRVVAAVLTPLAGSFGAVFLGSVFLDRWKLDQQRSDRRAWLGRNAALIADQQQLARDMLSEIAVEAYDLARGFVPVDERVTDELLRWDVETGAARHDLTAQGAMARIDDLMRVGVNGPLTWATRQAAAIADTASRLRFHRVMDEQAAEINRMAQEVEDDDVRELFDSSAVGWEADELGGSDSTTWDVARLRELAPGVGTSVVVGSERAAAVLRDLGTLEHLRPLREEADDAGAQAGKPSGPAPGAALVHASHRLTSAAHLLARATTSLESTDASALEPSDETVAVLDGLSELLRSVSRARSSLQLQATLTSQFAAGIDASSLAGIAAAASRGLAEHRGRQHAEEWRRFSDGRARPRRAPRSGRSSRGEGTGET